MPSTLIALEPLASLLAAYRLTLALQLGRQVGWEGNWENDHQFGECPSESRQYHHSRCPPPLLVPLGVPIRPAVRPRPGRLPSRTRGPPPADRGASQVEGLHREDVVGCRCERLNQ